MLAAGGRIPSTGKGGGGLESAGRRKLYFSGMPQTFSSHPLLAELLAQLEVLDARITSETEIARGKLSELRRQSRARPRRRGGVGLADTRKYAIGGAITLLTGEIDATTLLGLLAQTDTMLKWMAQERLARGTQPFGALLAAILADRRKSEWCRSWGAVIEWCHRKVLYDAAVTRFERSGRTGMSEPWRRRPVSSDQAELVETLCRLREISPPAFADRGAAYEWIKSEGGNPSLGTAETSRRLEQRQ